MAEGFVTILIYVAMMLIAILFIYLGLKFGEYIARRRGKQKFEFREELDKIVDEWKRRRREGS